jgi:Ca2+-binding RTX toxin-like protein
VAPVPQREALPVEKGARRAGLLLVVVGALLLTLATGDALADAVLGGSGHDVLRGTGAGERLAGFGGEDGIWGLAGDDELYGGLGSDMQLGGAGDDFIEARDGERDYVECGSGNDVASVDLGDRVARNCETLYPG